MALTDTKADTASLKYALVEETTYGTTPATNAWYTRVTGDTLQQKTEVKKSEEITGDRNPRGPVRTGISAMGGLNFEFSSNTFEIPIAHGMMSAWSSAVALTGRSIDISGVSGGTCTLTDAGSASSFNDVVVGQWIKLGGFTPAGNNSYCWISAKASANSVTAKGLAWQAETGQTDISISSAGMIRIGTTKKSLSIERQWTDVNVFDLFNGMRVNQWGLDAKVDDFLKGSFDFMGLEHNVNGSTQVGTVAAAGSDTIANCIDHIRGVYLGGYTVESTEDISEFTVRCNNNLGVQRAIGSTGPIGVRAGGADVTGTVKLFLKNSTELAKYLAFTENLAAFRIDDTTSSGVTIVTIPSFRYTDGKDLGTGRQADGFVELTFDGAKDANGVALQIDRFA